MKILVTGTAGFIGFHLAKRLLERGEEVIGVDDLNDYYSVKLKKDRNEILQKNPNYKFHKIDVADYEKLKEVFSDDIDCVVNLAAQAGVRYSLKNPHVYEKSNNKGFLNILELCKKFEIKNIVYASSSSVYGESTEIPFKEDQKLDKPISLYAATKKSNELIAYTYHHLYNLNLIGLRFFTVYGEWGRPDMALYKFVKNIVKGKPIDVYNNGDMKRDFTYISDIIDGVVAAIDNPMEYEVINLGRGEPQDLMYFIKCIEKALGKKAMKNMMGMQPGDVPLTYADTTKAEKLLDYNPKISIEEGVKRFVEWFKQYYKVN
ncbi:NAD-dependent epimerase/dehydratase family protein [Candidatus Woesearchaeota archaeon]|nr:NAD-dependent epimerase/dehydratase family protein [Candidatus Woesearchaeota archaeon]